jgi:ABC-2 type transport system permease protein
VPVARSVNDLLTAVLGAGIVAATGFAIGWSPNDGAGQAIAAFALVLLFGYAVSWGCACLGLVSKGVETAQALGLLVLFPVVFVSNALVPTQRMTPWLRDFTTWNPVSAVAAAARQLLGNHNPSAALHAWPMQHPVYATLIWSIGLLIILAPTATVLSFGNAGPGPSRYIIILPARLDELISALHEADRAEHAAIYRRYESELLE